MIVLGVVGLCLVILARKAFRNEALREFWGGWSHDERYYRRFNFGLGVPVMTGLTVFMLAVGEWTAAAIVGTGAVAAIVGAIRTPWPRGDGTLLGLLRRWFRLSP